LEIETVGVMYWDLTTGCLVDANNTFLNMMGYNRSDVEARKLTWQEFTPPEYHEVSLAEIRKLQRTGRVGPYEKEYFRKDGTRQWLLFAGSSLGGKQCVEFCVDISNRKRAEEALVRLNEKLEEKVAERTELAEARSRQLQALAIELIEAEERERREFAHLLHDDLQQILAAAKMHVQAVLDTHNHPLLANATKLLEDSIAKSRRLSHELSPAVLHQSGLSAALNVLIGQMKEQFGLEVKFAADVNAKMGSTPVKVFFYRAARELLFNIVKHAGVQKAHLFVSVSDGTAGITVSDQGRGFNPQTLGNSTSGFGLLSIKERASYIGAT
jgi:PAS domain S-box-containing protein